MSTKVTHFCRSDAQRFAVVFPSQKVSARVQPMDSSSGIFFVDELRPHVFFFQVIAQLVIDGKHYGIHNFIVPIRGEDHRPLPGIRCVVTRVGRAAPLRQCVADANKPTFSMHSGR